MLENPYCTVTDVQAELRNSEAAIVDIIEDAITAASRMIDERQGRDFYYHDHTTTPVRIDADDDKVFGHVLFLPYRPIITLTEVRVAGEVWGLGTDYVRKADKLLSLREEWPVGIDDEDAIFLKGTFGFVQASTADVPTGIPATVRRACILIAAALSGHNQKDIVGLDGNRSSVTNKEIPKEAWKLLGAGKIAL